MMLRGHNVPEPLLAGIQLRPVLMCPPASENLGSVEVSVGKEETHEKKWQ